jgi:D-alanyl-D-alanine-carboxypeptidase/D-alanyl-D-alanine-endopeptidase
VVVGLAIAHGAEAQLVEPAKLDALSTQLIDNQWVYGAVVGLVNEQGTHTAGYGRVSEQLAEHPDAQTVFEIGSISKVFTGLLLADMVARGDVALNDPVQSLLGDTMTVPKRGDRQITLEDLATHSSGLPRLPLNLRPTNVDNPYADYSVEQMAKFLATYQLPRDPGARSEYSNLGVGLLGHALARRAGQSYEQLLETRICEPLRMPDTRITLDAARRARLASGHDADGKPVANWDLPTLAGAGAIRSTAADMLKFLAANLELTPTPLAAAMADSQRVHFKNPPQAGGDIGLAWQIDHAREAIWHNGGTGGYRSFCALVPKKRAAVVVLSGTAAVQVDAWGWSVLKLLVDGKVEPVAAAKSIELDPDSLARLEGRYELGALGTVTVSRDDGRLFLQLSGQPKVRMYPESKERFFLRAVDAAVTFDAGEDGTIEKLVIHQAGQDVPAVRKKQ